MRIIRGMKTHPRVRPTPLCCSSLTTAVGGTKDTNIVDSESPYRGTNHQLEVISAGSGRSVNCATRTLQFTSYKRYMMGRGGQ